jgi:hypothetical protein
MDDVRTCSSEPNWDEDQQILGFSLDTQGNTNCKSVQSEPDEGVYLQDLATGAVLEVETRERLYLIENLGVGEILISGHPKYCPQPVQVKLHGSTWGGTMLKVGFIGQGMRLEFRHPVHGVILTSSIHHIRQLPIQIQPNERHLASTH